MLIRTRFSIERIGGVALIFMSAIFVVSCREKPAVDSLDKETLVTMQSTNLTLRNSANGVLSQIMETPLLEDYGLAEEPYMEFRKGIKVTEYNKDSTRTDIVADYAKYLKETDLWEARGNVVVTTSKGQVLRTEQLFYDHKSDRIYSNVHTVLVDGEDVHTGNSFESNSRFDKYHVRQQGGSVTVEAEPNRDTSRMSEPDTLSTETFGVPEAPAAEGSL